jgi:hypothetical protein
MRTFDTGATRDSDDTKPDYSGFMSPLTTLRLEKWVLRERDLAWAGGLFEGEGCIGLSHKAPSLQVRMCDEDSVRRFGLIVGAGKVYGPYETKPTADHKPKSPWRPNFLWTARSGAAIEVAKLLFPYLGSRRQSTLVEKWGVIRLAEVAGISPLVIQRYGEYMHANQVQADGSIRSSSNWKKGIPIDAYMQSMWRHLEDVWLHHEDHAGSAREGLEEALCAVIFNASGYLHEILKESE